MPITASTLSRGGATAEGRRAQKTTVVVGAVLPVGQTRFWWSFSRKKVGFSVNGFCFRFGTIISTGWCHMVVDFPSQFVHYTYSNEILFDFWKRTVSWAWNVIPLPGCHEICPDLVDANQWRPKYDVMNWKTNKLMLDLAGDPSTSLKQPKTWKQFAVFRQRNDMWDNCRFDTKCPDVVWWDVHSCNLRRTCVVSSDESCWYQGYFHFCLGFLKASPKQLCCFNKHQKFGLRHNVNSSEMYVLLIEAKLWLQ